MIVKQGNTVRLYIDNRRIGWIEFEIKNGDNKSAARYIQNNFDGMIESFSLMFPGSPITDSELDEILQYTLFQTIDEYWHSIVDYKRLKIAAVG